MDIDEHNFQTVILEIAKWALESDSRTYACMAEALDLSNEELDKIYAEILKRCQK